jgi:hypothetical protein
MDRSQQRISGVAVVRRRSFRWGTRCDMPAAGLRVARAVRRYSQCLRRCSARRRASACAGETKSSFWSDSYNKCRRPPPTAFTGVVRHMCMIAMGRAQTTGRRCRCSVTRRGLALLRRPLRTVGCGMGVQQKTLMSREKIMQAMWVAARALQWKKQPVVGAPQQNPMARREDETAAIAAAAPTLSSMHVSAHVRREDVPARALMRACVRSARL